MRSLIHDLLLNSSCKGWPFVGKSKESEPTSNREKYEHQEKGRKVGSRTRSSYNCSSYHASVESHVEEENSDCNQNESYGRRYLVHQGELKRVRKFKYSHDLFFCEHTRFNQGLNFLPRTRELSNRLQISHLQSRVQGINNCELAYKGRI